MHLQGKGHNCEICILSYAPFPLNISSRMMAPDRRALVRCSCFLNDFITLMLSVLCDIYVYFSDCLCQLCDKKAETLPPQIMKQSLFPTAVPRGKINAGYYEEDLKAINEGDCLYSCCEKPLCNIAWYSMDKCFTIECFENDESACEPVTQSTTKYNKTLFIQVRPLSK